MSESISDDDEDCLQILEPDITSQQLGVANDMDSEFSISDSPPREVDDESFLDDPYLDGVLQQEMALLDEL